MNPKQECIKHQKNQKYYAMMAEDAKSRTMRKHYQEHAAEAYKLMWEELKHLIKIKD